MGFIIGSLAQSRLVSTRGEGCRRIEMGELKATPSGAISVSVREQGCAWQVQDLEAYPGAVSAVVAAVGPSSVSSVQVGDLRQLSVSPVEGKEVYLVDMGLSIPVSPEELLERKRKRW